MNFLLVKQSLKFYALATSVLVTSQVQAAAFANLDLTPAGAGSANAVVAAADDLSSVFYNPAGLAWQEGVQASFGNQSRYRTSRVGLAAGTYDGDVKMPAVNTFAFSWLPKGGNWGVSASMATPYGTHADWGAAFPTLGDINLNMTRYASDVFWRANNTLGISAGLDIYDARLSLNSNGSSFSGSSWSKLGVHAGVRWEFMPFWALGVHLRQGASANLNDATGSSLDMTLPDEWNVGLAHNLMDDEMLVELDIKHSTWSSFKDLVVSKNGVNTQSLAVNFKNTTDVMLGFTWYWRHNTQLRFGYGYEQAANPTSGYQPMLSDLAGHRLTAGFGGMMMGMHLDMAYTAMLYPKAGATGAYAGNYSDARYSFMFSLSKKF